MKVSVRFEGHLFVVPCGDGSNLISWLIEESVRRGHKQKVNIKASHTVELLEARLLNTHAILSKDDKITDVLDNNDVIYVGKC